MSPLITKKTEVKSPTEPKSLNTLVRWGRTSLSISGLLALILPKLTKNDSLKVLLIGVPALVGIILYTIVGYSSVRYNYLLKMSNPNKKSTFDFGHFGFIIMLTVALGGLGILLATVLYLKYFGS